MLEYAAKETELNTPDEQGVPYRDTLKELARRGRTDAKAELDNPFPDTLSYLYDAAISLVGRSGVGMAGFSPLSPSVVKDWMEITDNKMEPHEVEALFALDNVMRAVPEKKEEVKKDEPVEIAPWPTKKTDNG